MSTTTTNTQHRSARPSKLRAKLRELDAMYDAWSQTEEGKAMAVIGTGLLMLILAVVVFGYPALIIAALTAVPVIFTLLLLITVGK